MPVGCVLFGPTCGCTYTLFNLAKRVPCTSPLNVCLQVPGVFGQVAFLLFSHRGHFRSRAGLSMRSHKKAEGKGVAKGGEGSLTGLTVMKVN